MKKIYNYLLAFFGGVLGVSLLYIVFAPFCFFPSLVVSTTLWLTLLSAGFLEEGIKFLLINRDIGKYPYGYLLGFGFGLFESIFVHPFWIDIFAFRGRTLAILMHMGTAFLICYFVKKKKPIRGLLIAIAIHTLWNVFWVVLFKTDFS